jgi:hypothetical protein
MSTLVPYQPGPAASPGTLPDVLRRHPITFQLGVNLVSGDVTVGQPGHAGKAALGIADKIASAEPQARAHEGLGDLSAVTGDPTGARPHWQQALARYTEMGVPHDADRIRAKLAVTDNPAKPGQRRSATGPDGHAGQMT